VLQQGRLSLYTICEYSPKIENLNNPVFQKTRKIENPSLTKNKNFPSVAKKSAMQHHQQNHTIPQLQAQPPPPPPPPGMLGPSNGQQQPQSQQPMNVHSGSVMSQAQRPYPQMGMHQQQQQPQQHHLQPSSHQQPQQQYMIHHQQQQQSSHQQQQQQSAGQQQQVMGNVHSYPVYSDHSQQPHQRQHSSAFGQQSAHSNNVMHLYQKLSQSSEKSWSLIGINATEMF
jgi:hypothetical protein